MSILNGTGYKSNYKVWAWWLWQLEKNYNLPDLEQVNDN